MQNLSQAASRIAALLAVTLSFMAPAGAGDLVVGGKNFTEQLILSSMTQQYLSAKGYTVDLKNGLGTTIMRQALESGQIDKIGRASCRERVCLAV